MLESGNLKVYCDLTNAVISLYVCFSEWRYGAVMCKVTPYLQAVSVCASVNTLAAIAVDR